MSFGAITWCDAAPPIKKHNPEALENRLKVYNYYKTHGPCGRLIQIEGIKRISKVIVGLIKSGYLVPLPGGMVKSTDKIPKVH